MPTSNVTSIVDFDKTFLQVTHEGQVLLIKKVYVRVKISPDDPNIVEFRWHWYEWNDGQRLFYLDFNRITAPATISAAALLAAIEAMLISQFVAGAGVTSVSGTANRITSSGGATPVIDIDAAYDALWQPVDADLTAIAALGFASISFLTKTAANTWALDTNTIPITASGTYTPTRSAEANMDANVTMALAQYMRVGSTVTVSGSFQADPTLTATATSFEITLPIASNIGAVNNLAGVAFCGNVAGMGAGIVGSVANDTAKIAWVSSDITNKAWSYTFTYTII